MTDHNCRDLLLRALDGDEAALDKLLSDCADVPPEIFGRMRTRVAGWLSSMIAANKRDEVTERYFRSVVDSNIRNFEIERLLCDGKYKEAQKLVQPQLRGIVYGRVQPPFADDVMNDVWTEAVMRFVPEKGGFINLLRVIATSMIRKYSPTVPLTAVREGHVEPDRLPESACFDALLTLVVREEPHKAIAYLCSRLLDIPPREIDSRFSAKTLGAIIDDIEHLYCVGSRMSDATRQSFQNLRNAVPVPDRTLKSFYARQPAASIASWTSDVAENVRRALVRMQVRFLTLMFSLSCEPHKLLTYAYLVLLCWAPEELWHCRNATLFRLKDDFPNHYPSDELDSARMQAALEPVATALSRPRLKPAGDASIAEKAGDARQRALSYWRTEVNRVVCRRSREEHLQAIAYINGAVERTRQKEEAGR
jgi:hypothetical protein